MKFCDSSRPVSLETIIASGLARSGRSVCPGVFATLAQQRAPSTSKVYVSRFNIFRAYVFRRGVMSVFPVQVVLVLDWLQTYVDRGCVAGTISGMFDAVSWCAAKAGFDSLRGDSLVQDFLQGCVRVCPPQRSGGKVCWTVSMLHRVFGKHEEF